MKVYIRILKYLRPYWLIVSGAILAMVIFATSNVYIIPLMRDLSVAISNRNLEHLTNFAILAFVLYSFRSLFQYWESYLMAYAGQKVVRDMRVHVFRHIQDLSLHFFSEWRTGDVISRVMNDISIVQTSVVSAFTEIAPNALTFCGVLGYLLYLNWKLTLLTLVLTPLFGITMTRFSKSMRDVAKKTQRKTADISSMLQENISGARVVKSFTREDYEVQRFAEESDRSFHYSMRESQIDAYQKPVLGFMQIIAFLIVIWFGGFQVFEGNLSPQNLIAFFTGIALLIDPIIVLSKTNTSLQRAVSAAERVFEVIDIKTEVPEKKGAVKLPRIKGLVEFRNVYFSYEKDGQEVLKDISLKANPGEIIALVGPSGAGKTSMVNLIPRFYDPSSGEISIDGVNIKDVTLFSLRNQMGIVPQETLLFSGSVRENISYGKLDATNEEIGAAALLANAHDFIEELPFKYKTQVGERGLQLSGGQRQRIAIARAILRDPKIIILDEATSSLDSESEQLVQDAMEKLMSNRTTFVIAHRLSTIQHSTKIVVMDEGKIVEVGTHNELLEKSGLYRRLYDIQFQPFNGGKGANGS